MAHTHGITCLSSVQGRVVCFYDVLKQPRRSVTQAVLQPIPNARRPRPSPSRATVRRAQSDTRQDGAWPRSFGDPRDRCSPVPRTPKLTRAQRAALPDWCFAIPETRDYPLTDKHRNWDPFHAKEALSHLVRVAGRHGPNPKTARRVVLKVRTLFPDVYRCELDLINKIAIRHRLRRAH